MAIHGPPLNDLKEMAKQRVMHTFASIGLSDRVPDTMRVMYALKVQQATSYIAAIDAGETGYTSLNRCVEDEAEARGYTPYQMATIILHMAGESMELEARRINANLRIEAAANEIEVKAILDELNISLQPSAYGF